MPWRVVAFGYLAYDRESAWIWGCLECTHSEKSLNQAHVVCTGNRSVRLEGIRANQSEIHCSGLEVYCNKEAVSF